MLQIIADDEAETEKKVPTRLAIGLVCLLCSYYVDGIPDYFIV